MAILALDLGGTKLAGALFTSEGMCLHSTRHRLDDRQGDAVGELIRQTIRELETHALPGDRLSGIGMSVPGLYRRESGRVWAPNIPGWEDYPLKAMLSEVSSLPVCIESDRTCSILGERWQGGAQGCSDAIFITVGTGIGAGILANGQVLRGSGDLAGAIGWMALGQPFQESYQDCGHLEYYASGRGIARHMRRRQGKHAFSDLNPEDFRARYVLEHYRDNPHARQIVEVSLSLWGMAAANLISIFNPEVIFFGGGLFGQAAPLIARIREEAAQWAQPLAMQSVRMELTHLNGMAALYGVAYQCIFPSPL